MIVLRKVSNETDQDLGYVVIRVPVAEKFSADDVEAALKRHMSASNTLARIIRVEIQIFVCSIGDMTISRQLVSSLFK